MRAAALVLALTCLGGSTSARAASVIQGTLGLSAPLHGDTLEKRLESDLGFSGAASVAVHVYEGLFLAVRYDALLIDGTVLRGQAPRFDRLETDFDTHGFTLGPGLAAQWDRFEAYAVVTAGVHLTRFRVDGDPVTVPAAERRPRTESERFVGFGLAIATGGRWDLGDGFLLGVELSYHYLRFNGVEFPEGAEPRLDDDVGAIGAGVTAGYRF